MTKAKCDVAHFACGGQISALSHQRLNPILGSDPDPYQERKPQEWKKEMNH